MGTRPEVSFQSNAIKVVHLFIQSFHFHPNHFVCYYAIKGSIFDLKGRDEKNDRIQWRTSWFAQFWHSELSWKNCNFVLECIYTPKAQNLLC